MTQLLANSTCLARSIKSVVQLFVNTRKPQGVASLLAIQGRRQPDRAVRALFEEAQDRLNAVARVHDLLSKAESIQRVDLAIYFTDLCEALRPITENDSRVGFNVSAESGILVEAEPPLLLASSLPS